jgi:hypothetical protein
MGLEHLQHETHIGQEEQNVAEELMVKINILTSAVEELIALKERGVSVDELLNREDETIHPALGSYVEQLREHKAVHMGELAAAEEKLHKTLSDMERFNRLAVGREQQMIELKLEVNNLLRSLGRQEKYRITTSENDKNIE